MAPCFLGYSLSLLLFREPSGYRVAPSQGNLSPEGIHLTVGHVTNHKPGTSQYTVDLASVERMSIVGLQMLCVLQYIGWLL